MGRVVGFVGCYSHDIILMLAKVFACLEEKVLVRDCNVRHTLYASVPIPDNISLKKDVVEYDGVFFTGQKAEEMTEPYKMELVDFGMDVDKEQGKRCTDWVVITDMLLHHIRHLEESGIEKEAVRACVIRDAFQDSCKTEPEVRQFLHSFLNAKQFFLPPDFRDVRNRYVCETTHEYNVNRASPELRDMIFCLAEKLGDGCSEKEIRKKMRRLERRRYR